MKVLLMEALYGINIFIINTLFCESGSLISSRFWVIYLNFKVS